MCVSSEQVRPFYAQAFGIDIARVLPLGTPRTDALLRDQTRSALREELLTRRPEMRGKRIYLYTPTFREQNGKPCAYDPQINWEALDDALADDELFVIRRHPIMKESFLGGQSFRHIVDATREPTQALLTVASLVVTDYSSVIYDALLCGLPLVFYCPDLNAYERDFTFPIRRICPAQPCSVQRNCWVCCGRPAHIRRSNSLPSFAPPSSARVTGAPLSVLHN